MRGSVLVLTVLAVAVSAWPGQVLALGCDAKTQVPGHIAGNLGITDDVPTTPCPVGHYAALQKKRNSSALFARPLGAPGGQTDPLQTNSQQ